MIPEQWEEIFIKSVSKNKDGKTMSSKRSLFLTNIVSKMIEKLLKNRGKKNLEENANEFQCGGTRGKSIGDNLLILNSAGDGYREKNLDMFVLFADLKKQPRSKEGMVVGCSGPLLCECRTNQQIAGRWY